MHDAFKPDELPPPRQVDYDALNAATSETPFVREGFELLKDAMVVLTTVAGLRTPSQAAGLDRNHAIIVGQLRKKYQTHEESGPSGS